MNTTGNKKKILLITKKFAPEIGGGIRRIEAFYDILMAREDVELTVITTTAEAPKLYKNVVCKKQLFFKDKINSDAIRFSNSKTAKLSFVDKALLGWLPNVLFSIFWKKYDYVIGTSPSFTNVLIAWTYKLFHKKTRLIVEYRDFFSFNPVYREYVNVMRAQHRELSILKKASRVIVTTPSMKKILSGKMPADKITVIKNHISAHDKKKADQSEKIILKSGFFHIGYVGVLNTGRDPSPVLKLLDSQFYGLPVMLHFVGTNSKEEAFIKECAGKNADRVYFYGVVDRLTSLRYMKSFDAVLLLINRNASIAQGYGIPGKLYDYIQTNNTIISDTDTLHNLADDFATEVIRQDTESGFVTYKITEDYLLDDILNGFFDSLEDKP